MLFNKVFRFISIILLFTNVSGWREPPSHTFGKQYRGSQYSGSQHRGSQHSDSLNHNLLNILIYRASVTSIFKKFLPILIQVFPPLHSV